MDRITEMTAFARVLEAGSFARAAETMRMPRATLTRMVQSLERRLDVRLLQRSTRAFKVTPEGEKFYERAVGLLAHFEEVESSAKKTTVELLGAIRIDLSASLGVSVMAPALSEFYSLYPGVRVELGVSNADADLLADGVDCAIRIGKIRDESLVARRVGNVRFVTCAAPDLLARTGVPAHPDELNAPDRVLGFVSMRTGRPVGFAFSRGDEMKEVRPAWRLLVNDTNAYVASGVAGLGFIQAPSFAVAAAIRSGTLVPVLEEWSSVSAPVHLVYPSSRFVSARVRAFIDWAVGRLAQDENFARPAGSISPS